LGGFDGTASLLGVIVFLLATHPGLIFPTALSGAISAALSMAAGWWLSNDNRDGLAGSSVMGAATLVGALLPAVPFAFGTGRAEIAECAVICLCVGVMVAALRTDRSLPLALAETFGLLLVIAGVTAGCALAWGSGGLCTGCSTSSASTPSSRTPMTPGPAASRRCSRRRRSARRRRRSCGAITARYTAARGSDGT
jgi:VIT1/CCC1 family predicted Fe2+/Mn2+ transporter